MQSDIYSLSLVRRETEHRASLGFSYANERFLLQNKDRFLVGEESAYLNSLPPGDRISFLNSRYLAKKMLQLLYPDSDLIDFEIRKGIFEQPYISTRFAIHSQISISHHQNFAAALIFPADYLMGVDVQKVEPANETHVLSQCTPLEASMYANHEEKHVYLTKLWTMKEALSKTLRTGLACPMSFFEVEKLAEHDAFSLAFFKNFIQYKALNFIFASYSCSVVLPAQTDVIMKDKDGRRRIDTSKTATGYFSE